MLFHAQFVNQCLKLSGVEGELLDTVSTSIPESFARWLTPALADTTQCLVQHK